MASIGDSHRTGGGQLGLTLIHDHFFSHDEAIRPPNGLTCASPSASGSWRLKPPRGHGPR